MIELVNMSEVYQETYTSENIHFPVRPEEIIGIVGKNGSDKSILLHLLNLMEQPSEGEIRTDGRNVQTSSRKEVRQQQQQIGMVSQHYNLLENSKIYDDTALPLKLLKEKQPEKIECLLTFTDMTHRAETYPAQLSDGGKQRVSIAQTLSRSPKWLLRDEITSPLDEENTENVVRLLHKTHQEFRPIIFFAGHGSETMKRLCDRVLVMKRGQLIGEFLNNPR